MFACTCLFIFVTKQAELQLCPTLQHAMQFRTYFFAVPKKRVGSVAAPYSPWAAPSTSERKAFQQQKSVPSELAC